MKWPEKYKTLEERTEWMVRVAVEALDLLKRRNSTDGDFLVSILTLKRIVDALVEQVGR